MSATCASHQPLPAIFMNEQQTHFKAWFDKTIKEQFEIRQELIGQSIVEIFYTPKVEGWDINIIDDTVIHLPLGYLTFVTSNGLIYEINTNYQSFCGGLFGIMLTKKTTRETHNPTVYTLTNYTQMDKKWNDISKNKISKVEWNWKEPTLKSNQVVLTRNEVQKYIFEDCFVPENLVFEFDNKQKILFFGLEPDTENTEVQTYSLISCGEEIMIFLDETKLKNWNINTIGYQIEIN